MRPFSFGSSGAAILIASKILTRIINARERVSSLRSRVKGVKCEKTKNANKPHQRVPLGISREPLALEKLSARRRL